MHRLFVTGTDTGVGKTFVTAAMARRARALGQKVFALKPIETGCEVVPEGDEQLGLRAFDQEIITEAAGNWQRGEQRGVYKFVRPLAPLAAARAESRTIDIERILAVASGAPGVDLLLVEGAGGWRVPITEDADMSVLARRLEARVVIVGRAGLGTINHSLLTIEAVERDRLPIAGVVLSRRHNNDDDAFARANRDEIRRRWNGKVVVFDTDPSVLDPIL
jgi:dethiobiotin synthetase